MGADPSAWPSAGQEAVITDLRARLREAEDTLDAIRCGEVDAVLVNQAGSNQIFTLVNADRPYRSLIEQMKEGAVTLSEDGVVLYGNRRLGEILRAPLEQIVGSNIKRFFVGGEAAKFESLLATTGPEPSRAELRAGLAEKDAVAVFISINDIVSEPGAARLIGGVLTDLTEQHVIDARFSHARKMEAVGQLSGGLAHEFNNLFQTVCGNLSLIRLRPHDEAGVRKWADSGLRAANRGSKLTSQLLAFSTTHKLDVQPVDVGSLIRGMAELLRTTLGPEICVHYELEVSGLRVLADKTQLELAILNLSLNARDAMPGGGGLRITTALRAIGSDPELAAGPYLEVSIADTGYGMEDSVRARAFDPFFTTKSVGQGSGLGLAQVYGIARQSGGAARIASAPGTGTTVTLLLRQAVAAPLAAVMDGASALAAAEKPGAASILVIDDDEDVRGLLVESLVFAGYEVRDAVDGQTGLDLMAISRPDLLLIDYLMPGLNGAAVVKLARERGFDMPVIFSTGYADTRALDAAIGLKATVLAKPYTVGDLQQAIAAALRGDR
jgi:signal transduction histidine kinase/CheY-like chemotaxis protein